MIDVPRPLPRSAALIVNAHSRRGRALFRKARAKLEAAGVALLSAHEVPDPCTLGAHVRDAVKAGAPMVIVGGGDGSLSGAVDHLVGTDTVFALLPLGTANSFARTLGIPLDLDGAIAVIAGGCRRRIDLGMIDDDYFANGATLGIAPLVAETIPDGLKRLLGRPGYLAWGLWKMARFRPFRLALREGKTTRHFDAVEVHIANGPYHGGAEVVEGADVDTREIVMQVVEGRSRHRLAWSWLASLFRLKSRRRTVHTFHGPEFRIATDPPLPVSIDGEVLARTPFIARVAPDAIEVAAPRQLLNR